MNQQKKVVIVGTAYPFRGGLASYNERLAQEFHNQGFDVKIYTFTTQYPNFLFPGKTQFVESEKSFPFPIKRVLNSVNPFSWIKLGRKLKKEAPDILVFKFWIPFIGPSLGTVGRIAKKNKTTKVVTILDNVIPHEHRPGDKQLTRYFINAVDGFISMSQSVKNDLDLFRKNQPSVLQPHPLFDNYGDTENKVDAANFLKLNPEKDYALFFGVIRDYKGLDILLEGYAQALKAQDKFELIVAGEFYEDDTRYMEIIKKHQLQNNVHLHTRFIPDEEVKYYFSLVDVIVQPYKTATQSGVTQLAYHFEKPMLVTEVGGLPELVPHNKAGLVVQPNAESVTDGLNQFAELPKDHFASGIAEQKAKFGWDKMVNEILKLA